MKKKCMYIFVLSIFLCLSLTSCINEKNEDIKENNQNQEQIKNDVNKNTEDTVKKADEEMVKFTKPYLDIYNQEDNAFIELSFKNKDFVPKDLFEKAKLIKIDEDNKKPLIGYKMVISCEDNVLFRVNYNKYQEVEEHGLDNFYMSRGDFFLMELRQSESTVMVVNAYKNLNFYTQNSVHIDFDAEDLFEEGEVLHDVFFWQREEKPSIFIKTISMLMENNTVYKKTASVDLDGDNKEEKIYFWGETEHFAIDDENGKNVSKRLIIDEYEIPLDKLSKENALPEIEELYEEELSGIEIIDIDPNDKYKEILLKKMVYGPATFLGKLYHFENKEMKYIGTIEYFGDSNELLSGLYDDKLVVKAMGYLRFNYIFDDIYRIEEDKLVKQEDESIKMNSFYKRIVVYLKKELNLYEKIDSKEPIEKLKIGDHLIFLETDSLSWIKVKSANTGKIGYIKFSKGEEEYQLHFDDQEELKDLEWTDIFAKLPMWG